MPTDPAAKLRDGFLFEQYQDNGEDRSMTTMIPSYVGFRTEEWKYIEYETGEQELYNLTNDLYEMANLIGNSGYDDVTAGLQGRIDKIRSR